MGCGVRFVLVSSKPFHTFEGFRQAGLVSHLFELVTADTQTVKLGFYTGPLFPGRIFCAHRFPEEEGGGTFEARGFRTTDKL